MRGGEGGGGGGREGERGGGREGRGGGRETWYGTKIARKSVWVTMKKLSYKNTDYGLLTREHSGTSI